MTSLNSFRLRAAARSLAAAILILIPTVQAASAQALSVLPVNIFFSPGQLATTLTVTNHGNSETSIQIRVYAWNQEKGEDQLTKTDELLVSPPLATIAPETTQVVRLILRKPAQDRETTYRILLDQIPPPAEPGIVHIVLRLSIPIFAQPMTRVVPHIQFHIERDEGQLFLVGINDGLRHDAIRNIELSTKDGRKLKEEPDALPYILAGATRRWAISTQDPLPLPGQTLKLTAHADAGAIEQQVSFDAKP
jgi:fimbrial chaperone protein